MMIRFHLDPDTGLPHIYGHGITEEEVRQILVTPGRYLRGTGDSRMKLSKGLNETANV